MPTGAGCWPLPFSLRPVIPVDVDVLSGEVAAPALGLVLPLVEGLRYTDGPTMAVVQQVLCGQANKDLVATLKAVSASTL